MKSSEYIYYLFFGSIVLLAVLIVLIVRSNLEKNTKTVLYIVSVISPITGLVVYLILIARQKKKLQRMEGFTNN